MIKKLLEFLNLRTFFQVEEMEKQIILKENLQPKSEIARQLHSAFTKLYRDRYDVALVIN